MSEEGREKEREQERARLTRGRERGREGGVSNVREGAAVVNVWMSERERRQAGRSFTSLQRLVSKMTALELICVTEGL